MSGTWSALPRGLRALAAIATLAVPPLVYLISFQRLGRWLERGRPSLGPRWRRFDDAVLARRIDLWLYRLPLPWRRTCLKRAAVLFYLLRCGGRAVELHIGVRRDEAGRLAAHAWLVRDDQPYLEPPGEQVQLHKAIARFPERVATEA